MRRMASNPDAALLVTASLFVLLTACSTSDHDEASNAGRSAARVADSAGVRIVEHQLEEPSDSSSAWRVGGEPAWRFESIPRDRERELLGVLGAVFLEGGELVLAHRSKQELLVLDATGAFVRSIGRAGDGPGEFRVLTGPWRVGANTIAVYDPRLRRVTWLSTDGELLHSGSIAKPALPDSASRLWGATGVTTDGTLLVWADAAPRSEPGVDRPARWLVAVDSSGAGRTLGDARPGLERYAMAPNADGFVSMGLSPFAAEPLAAPCGSDVVTADNQSYAIAHESADGRMWQRVRARVAPRTADSADYAAAIRAQYPTADVSAESIAPLRLFTPSGLVPVLRSLQCDEQGNVWVEEHPHGDTRLRRIIVYAPDGERVRTVQMPAALRLLAVRSDAIAVLAFDEDGQERVEVYRVPSGDLGRR
jgi:hypothetical protein